MSDELRSRILMDGMGMMGGMWVMWLVVVLVIVVIAVAAYAAGRAQRERAADPRRSTPVDPSWSSGDPIDILRDRFARGEIDRDEYDAARRVLDT